MGGAIGYVLGARAGVERYQQIRQAAANARRHPAVNQITEQAKGLTDLARSTVARGLEEGSKGMRKAAGKR